MDISHLSQLTLEELSASCEAPLGEGSGSCMSLPPDSAPISLVSADSALHYVMNRNGDHNYMPSPMRRPSKSLNLRVACGDGQPSPPSFFLPSPTARCFFSHLPLSCPLSHAQIHLDHSDEGSCGGSSLNTCSPRSKFSVTFFNCLTLHRPL